MDIFDAINKNGNNLRDNVTGYIAHLENNVATAKASSEQHPNSTTLLVTLAERQCKLRAAQRWLRDYERDATNQGYEYAMAMLMQRAIFEVCDTSASTDPGSNVEISSHREVAKYMLSLAGLRSDSPAPFVGAVRHMAERRVSEYNTTPVFFMLGDSMDDGRFQVMHANADQSKRWHHKTYAKGERAKARKEAGRLGLREMIA